MSGFARLVAVIPVRSLGGAKTRLGEPLDAEERETLVRALLERAIAATRASQAVAATVVVSPDPEALALAAAAGATPLRQSSDGLNEALAEARAWLGAADPPERPGGADSLIVLPVDLPAVSAAELDRLIATTTARLASTDEDGSRPTPTSIVALVPDRHGTGTNVLLLAPPDAIAFRFGEDSRSLHAGAAAAAGATYLELDGPLSFDVDTPEDLLLADQAGLDHAAGR